MNKSESKYFNTAVRFNRALLSLLEQKPFEYITISEICKIAEVNRSTFYLHYDNTCDLLKETVTYLRDNFNSYFSVDIESFTAQFSNCNLEDLEFVNEKYLYPYLSFIKENQRVFLAILSQPNAFDSKGIFQMLFDSIFRPILDRFHYPKEDQNFVMLFYLNGITAIIHEWLKGGCQTSIADLSAIIHYCVYGRER